jgi:hypothetical protein
MANISLTLYTNRFFGSALKSPTQMGSLNGNNSVTNISYLGTFNVNVYVKEPASFGERMYLVRNVYYCTTYQHTGVVTSLLQYNINYQILVSLQNMRVSDTLKLDPKTINETPLPSPFDHKYGC